MTDSEAASKPPADVHGVAADALREEQRLRERWDQAQESLRERFDEPISRATELTQRTLAWFPVRVWRNFLQHEGFLLAAGVSYQTLFASFAAIYVVFASIGIWLGGNDEAVYALIDVINHYIPGLISENGLASPEDVLAIASNNSTTLTIAAVIALGTLIWTAIGAISFTRRAVRGVFGIAPDRRSYFLLKSLDFLAAIFFGAGLLLGTALGTFATWALHLAFQLFGLSDSLLFTISVRIITIVILLAVNTALLTGLFRFLTGTKLTYRGIIPGAALGAAAMSVLQLGFGLFLGYSPSNPLLATFTIFIVLLLWFRLIGIVLLVAASWIAVSAHDRNVPLVPQTEAERLAAEHQALLLAAQVRLRTAQEEREGAPWYRRWAADRAVREAEDELQQVVDSAPPLPAKRRKSDALASDEAPEKDVRSRR